MQIAASNSSLVIPTDISTNTSYTEYPPNTYFRVTSNLNLYFGEQIPDIGQQWLVKCINATVTMLAGAGIYYNGATSVGTTFQNSNAYGNFVITYTGLINDNLNFDLSGDISNVAP